jgi:hypothetical protein
VRPLKTKSAEEVASVFEQVLIDTNRHPSYIHSDQGSEFFNRRFASIMDSLNIVLYYSGSPQKSSICERVQRSLKERIYRYFTFKGTKKYIDVLQDFVSSYNNSLHRTINFKPADVRDEHTEHIYNTVYGNVNKAAPPTFSVGDTVRISRLKDFTKKGYTKGWSREIFTITAINRDSKPVATYKLEDSEDVSIKGSFMREEIQLCDNDPAALYSIEKILKTVGKGRAKKHLVKWLYWPQRFNSYVFDRDITRT